MHLIKKKLIGAGIGIATNDNTVEPTSITLCGVEAEGTGPVLQEYKARTHFLKGLSMDDIFKLKNGMAYLEFDVHGIDHTKPTINGRWYPADEMQRALAADAIVKQLNQGGICGRSRQVI